MTERLFEYDDEVKDRTWRAYLRGFDLGKNVESLNRIDIKTANTNFERWWDQHD